MWKQLESLRERSEEQKKMIALGVASVITLVILVTWITTQSFSLVADDETQRAQAAGPIEAMREQWRAFMGTLQEQE